MAERRCNLGDFFGRHAEPLKPELPLTHRLPGIGNQLRGLGLREGEHAVCGKRVVEGGEPPSRAYAQMQEAFSGVAWARQDVVKRAQAPARQPGVPQEAVVAQMVIVVAYEDVVDHALEEFGIVRADDARMAVCAHRLCEVRVRLRARFGLVAGNHGQAADEPQAVLDPTIARLREKQVVSFFDFTGRCEPVAVKAPNEHDLAVAKGAHVERGNVQACFSGQPHRGALNAGNVEAVLSAGKLGKPQHATLIAYCCLGSCTSERGSVDKDGLEVRGHRLPLFDAVGALQEVSQVV